MNIDQADPAELTALRVAFDVDDGGGSALGWEAVHAFEAEHRIVLPEPYRTFVAEITDGSYSGPPEYGLLSVAELPDDWGGEEQERNLSSPFPLAKAWMWEDDPHPAEDADALLEQVYNHGSIVLGTEGCAMNWHLIVTGPQRGNVWMISDVGAVPFGAQFGFTTAEPGFAGWVHHWAEKKPWYDPA
ncbi:SMI1/KNR4 family protein [Streptomyces sp. ME02-8801-2C]|uniref:SMI1/KNR4 family protein n=1 Tax=Streptomyces sp. ME02-8801-2C TaxID=3028680 RepID=UPI0029B96F87|nr:SMI1/KNR4 family protein [Streptomyces sp. ME02-8801-2C]MDX3456128.1 SMI1/KNR4 family protein [Streptomyces sp. ME02-8801-2C]